MTPYKPIPLTPENRAKVLQILERLATPPLPTSKPLHRLFTTEDERALVEAYFKCATDFQIDPHRALVAAEYADVSSELEGRCITEALVGEAWEKAWRAEVVGRLNDLLWAELQGFIRVVLR